MLNVEVGIFGGTLVHKYKCFRKFRRKFFFINDAISQVLIILYAVSFSSVPISRSLRRIVLFGFLTSVPEVRGRALGILEVIPGARGPRVKPLKHGLKQRIHPNSYRIRIQGLPIRIRIWSLKHGLKQNIDSNSYRNRIRIQGLQIRIRIWSLSNMAYNRTLI